MSTTAKAQNETSVRIYDRELATTVGILAAVVYRALQAALTDPESFVPITGNERRHHWPELSQAPGYIYDGYPWIIRSARELGEYVGLSESATAKSLKRLIKRGFIARIRNPIEQMEPTYWYRVIV
jgi:hypothetical protein